MAARADKMGGGGDGNFHVIDGAKRDAVVEVGKRLSAGGMDGGVEGEYADGFAKEGGLLVLRFGECDVDVVAAKGDGDAGEAAAGSVVEEGGDACWYLVCNRNRFNKMTTYYTFLIADGGEIGAGVPANKERKIGGKAGGGVGGERGQTGLGEERLKTGRARSVGDGS